VKRRKFIQFSGLSTASFLFTRLNPSTREPGYGMRFPDAISVRWDGEWFTLNGKQDHWRFQDLVVRFRIKDDSLALFIHAPGRALELIRCTWKQTTGASSKYLNDHWERSYGDLSWETTAVKRRSPWYTLISDGVKTQAFGVKTRANSICYWEVSSDKLELLLDTHSGGMGVQLGQRELRAADIITTESLPFENPFQTDTRFCRMMCPNPRLPSKPVYGINDWYFAYGNNSRDLILETTKLMGDLVTDGSNTPFSVIDAGWYAEKNDSAVWGPDVTHANDKFKDMAEVAGQIKKLGMRPGIWTRALQANSKDSSQSLIPVRKDQADPKERYLDPTIPENLDHIEKTFALYKSWGYDLVKQDYTSYDLFGRWGFEMNESLTVAGWHFQDRSQTNAEIILKLYRAMRSGSGDMYIIGCNTFSHLSAGIFELNRIGDDTSGKEWARTLKMGVNTLAFRLPQHNTFYAADGDCVGLTTQIPWEKNKQWLQLLAESSAPLFISAQPEALGADQKAAIKKAFAQAAVVQPRGEPLDWMTNLRPAEWKLNGEKVNFEWG